MLKKYIAYIGKTLIVLGIILLIAIFPGSVILSFIIHDERLYTYVFYGILLSFFVVALLVLLFMTIAAHTIQNNKNNKP